MIYKIYIENEEHLFEEVLVVNDVDDLFMALDTYILEEEIEKLIVSWYDPELDINEPIYLFGGNVSNYISFRDNYYYNEPTRGR